MIVRRVQRSRVQRPVATVPAAQTQPGAVPSAYAPSRDQLLRIRRLEPPRPEIVRMQALLPRAPTSPVVDGDYTPVFVSEDMDGLYLVNAQAYAFTAPAGGEAVFFIYDQTQAANLLDDELVISDGDNYSPTAASLSLLLDVQLQWGDLIKVSCVGNDGLAAGAGVFLEFGPVSAAPII